MHLSRLLYLAVFTRIVNAWFWFNHNQCNPVKFQVAAKADNYIFKRTINPLNSTEVIEAVNDNFAGGTNFAQISTVPVSGVYTIAGTYCEPGYHHRFSSDTLQILVHGSTPNSTYWSGLSYNDRYSWAAQALRAGQATLRIDRLGHGMSSHPDGVSVVQSPLQIEIYHQLLLQLKHPGHPCGSRKPFKKLIWVGHSTGSSFGIQVITKYPTDVDALILTGYGSGIPFPLPSILNNWATAPNFPGPDPINHALNAAYLRQPNATARQQAYFAKPGSFDPQIAKYEYDHSDTATVGEILSEGRAQVNNFTGPVLVATGGDDNLICREVQGACQPRLDGVKKYFPRAQKFDTYLVNGAGHNWVLHYAALDGFKYVFQWVKSLKL